MKTVVFFLFLPFFANAQIISTFAGGGASLGDGGPATAASIFDPAGILMFKNGECYIASGSDNRIRKIDSNGFISTIAGTGSSGYSGDGGLATNAKLNGAGGISIDAKGNVYFADVQNFVIRKINISTGIINTICGTGFGGYNGDNIPATSSQIYGINGICFDKFGNLYVPDGANERIRKIDTFGIIHTIAGTGVMGFSGDGGPATLAKVSYPVDVTFDDAGNLYFSDGTNRRIRKINTSGIISTIAGNGTATYIGDGMIATNAQFVPTFIKFDFSGNLFFSDQENNRAYKIDKANIFHLVAGDGMPINNGDGSPAIAAGVYYPSGLAFDTCDNLYIGDVTGASIRKVTFNPIPCTTLNVGANEEQQLLNIYPIPISDNLNVDNLKSSSRYFLLNLLGTIVQKGTLYDRNNTIKLNSIPDGIYILEIIDEQRNKTVKKIIKQ